MNKRFAGEKRTDKIELRIEPTLKELIDDVAFDSGVKLSDLIRVLIVEELRRNNRFKEIPKQTEW